MKKGRRHLTGMIFILASLIFVGFTPEEGLVPTLEGVLYKDLNHDKLKIDFYYPEQESEGSYPVVVFVHGGEWERGNKEDLGKGDLREVTESFRKEGFVVASIDYRTISLRSGFSSGVVDTKDAVRWIKKNAEEYQLDPENIGLWGVDRGGQIALLAAYTGDRSYQGIKSLASYSSGVKYILAYNPITDLIKRFQLDELNELDNATYQKRARQIYTLMRLSIRNTDQKNDAVRTAIYHSPVTYVAPDSPPTYLVCATGGDSLPEAQGKYLKSAFENNGMTLQMTVLETGTGRLSSLTADQRGFLTDISKNYLKMGAFHSENYNYDLIVYPDPNRLESIGGSPSQDQEETQETETIDETEGMWTQILQGIQKWFQ